MVELWAEKAWSGVMALAEIVSRRAKALPVKTTIIAVSTAFVAGRAAWIHFQQPAHLKEITDAYGSVNLMEKPAQFCHDFSRFTYVAFTDTRGMGIFVVDSATGEKSLVERQTNGPGAWHDDFDLRAWGWSMDDRLFAYSMQGSLSVASYNTNVPIARFPMATNNGVQELIWINGREFVWVEAKALGHAQKPVNGEWTIERLPLSGAISSLTAIDSHTIAWAQDGCICRFDFDKAGDKQSLISPSSASEPPLNGLIVWLDASRLKLSNGAPVTAMNDLSPGRNSVYSGENPPKFNAPGSQDALNGKGTLRFASSKGLTTSGNINIPGNAPRSLFAVMRRNWLMMTGYGNPGEPGGYFGLCDFPDALLLPCTMAEDTKLPGAPRSWNILGAVHDGSSQNAFVNGFLRGTTLSKLQTFDSPFQLGARTATSGNYWRSASGDGDLAEVLFYNRALNRQERQDVEKYLSTKWFGVGHLPSDSPLIWHDTGLDGISSFLYSKDTGQFLITTTNYNGRTLWVYTPESASKKLLLVAEDRALGQIRWAAPGGQYIYSGGNRAQRELFIANLTNNQPSRLTSFQDIRWFEPAPGGQKIMIWGLAANEPAHGLWEYDRQTQALRSVLPYSQHPSTDAKPVNYSTGQIKLPSGSNITCTIITPPGFDRHKKYPLVLGDTLVSDPIHGHWLQSGMAAGGALVVFVDRPWWTVDIDKWEEYVRAIYDVLKKDPCIDTRRVFLIGASAETQYMSRLLEKTPQFCAGAIFLNPGMLPDFAKAPPLQKRPRIFLNAGGEEHLETHFKQYQAQSLQHGAIVEYNINPSENHRFVGITGKLERLKAVNHFIYQE
jgi:acetyl esterase/lipase